MHIPIRLSKKAGVVLAVLVFALIGAVSFVFLKEDKKTEQTEENISNHEKENLLALLDSDGDGLKDWEEAIYTTDPKNPDTDGDGTKDGDEIAENRDPLQAGTNDILSLKEDRENTASYELLKRVAKEGNLTQTLIQNVIQQKGINSFLNPALAKKTSAEILAYIKELQGKETHENKISDHELIIADESNKESIQVYFNAIARVYEKHIFPLKEDDVEIVLEALQTQKQDPLLRLDTLLNAITRTVEEIKKISVPRVALDLHKKELGLGEQTIRDLEVLKSVNVDDTLFISALVNLRLELKKGVGNFHRKEVPDWLKEQKVTFAANADARKLYPL